MNPFRPSLIGRVVTVQEIPYKPDTNVIEPEKMRKIVGQLQGYHSFKDTVTAYFAGPRVYEFHTKRHLIEVYYQANGETIPSGSSAE